MYSGGGSGGTCGGTTVAEGRVVVQLWPVEIAVCTDYYSPLHLSLCNALTFSAVRGLSRPTMAFLCDVA